MKRYTDITKQYFIDLYSGNTDRISGNNSYEKAISYINENNFPTKKIEAWKNTDISPILKHKYSLGQEIEIDEHYIKSYGIYDLNKDTIVFINGFYSEKHSNIKIKNNGLFIGNMQKAKKERPEIIEKYFCKTNIAQSSVFTAINTAFSVNGTLIYIPDNHTSEQPIHIMNFIDGDQQKIISQSRNLFIAGKNAHTKIINSFHSLSPNFTLTNVANEIFLGQDSSIEFNVFQGEGDDAFQFNNTHVNQQKGSIFSSNYATLCGSIVRNEIIVEHKDEHCTSNLNGLYMPDREQHFDNYIYIKHKKPNCQSNQVYKGIIDNRAKAVFLGKVKVYPDAQKTSANQSNKNILLTDYAKVHSRPQLEIYADDVACAHGSTTGQIDKEAIYYLRTRGISPEEAKVLMLYAFASEIINKILIEKYKNFVTKLIDLRLKGEKVTGICSNELCPGCYN